MPLNGADVPPAGDVPATAPGGVAPVAPPMPAVRDRTLREFLEMMEEYAPIIPDAVTDYYLALSGLSTNDVRLKRLLALATQKFIADIAADAYQYSRIRQNSSNSNSAPGLGAAGAAAGVGGVGATGGGSTLRPMARPGYGGAGGSGTSGGRTVLTMEDLGSAVGEYGVNTRRPEFYR
ncbi:transcription initiation factor TFIID 23-30kDa subunit-domain-containing protein [Geopyxis carbonaria]|nr:transcription initiation factor TFIID 23-30kDa subunit-domain-containing protein [Geopyxis carbonaria]